MDILWTDRERPASEKRKPVFCAPIVDAFTTDAKNTKNEKAGRLTAVVSRILFWASHEASRDVFGKAVSAAGAIFDKLDA